MIVCVAVVGQQVQKFALIYCLFNRFLLLEGISLAIGNQSNFVGEKELKIWSNFVLLWDRDLMNRFFWLELY